MGDKIEPDGLMPEAELVHFRGELRLAYGEIDFLTVADLRKQNSRTRTVLTAFGLGCEIDHQYLILAPLVSGGVILILKSSHGYEVYVIPGGAEQEYKLQIGIWNRNSRTLTGYSNLWWAMDAIRLGDSEDITTLRRTADGYTAEDRIVSE